jgi:hypothetical protein
MFYYTNEWQNKKAALNAAFFNFLVFTILFLLLRQLL